MPSSRLRVLGLSACVLTLGAAALGAGAARADSTTINVFYSATSLSVKLSTGQAIPSGGSIPAGSYQVLVYDANDDLNPNFTMSGPGVSISSNLNSTGMGIDLPSTFGPFNFQAGATYSVQDTNLGPSSTQTFTASSSGGGTSNGGGGTTAGGGGTTPGGGTTSGAGGQSSGHGSSSAGSMTTIGTISGSVATSGKLALLFGGKALRTLQPGHYKITVVDHAKKAGLMLGVASARKPLTLSSLAASGTSSHTVNLTAGKWYFEPTARGPKTYFTVT
jgi:hypothetical protein